MKKETLFNWGIALLIIGSSLIGFGIGKIFDNGCNGSIIGLGVGLVLSSSVLFKVFRRLKAFEKNKDKEMT
jgi:Na+-driven multidrug efflux pump